MKNDTNRLVIGRPYRGANRYTGEKGVQKGGWKMNMVTKKSFPSYFTPKQFQWIRERMTRGKIPEGECINEDHSWGGHLFYIEEGCVKEVKFTEDGDPFILSLKQAGELAGAVGGFSPYGHSVHLIAHENTTVGILSQTGLEELFYEHPDLSIRFMEWMALEQRIYQSKLRDLMMHGKTGALCSTLLRLIHSCGEKTDEGIRIRTRLTHQDLARFICASRERVNRLLNELKAQKVLHIQRGHLVIIDPDRLREIAHCENCPREVCVI